MSAPALSQAAAGVVLTLSMAACGGAESSDNESSDGGARTSGGTAGNSIGNDASGGPAGGSGGGNSGAAGGTGGAGQPTSSIGHGQIVFAYQAGNPAQAELRASFHRPSSPECAPVATHGDCRFKLCPTTDPAASASIGAGVVSVAGGAVQLSSMFDAQAAGGYPDARQSLMTPLKGGEVITFATTGAEAPALSRQLPMVAPLLIVKPASTERSIPITRQGVTLEWQPGDSATAVLVSAFGSSADWTSLICSWPANLGTGAIPPAALAQLANGQELFISLRRDATEAVGDFAVDLSILTAARTATDPLPRQLVLTDAL